MRVQHKNETPVVASNQSLLNSKSSRGMVTPDGVPSPTPSAGTSVSGGRGWSATDQKVVQRLIDALAAAKTSGNREEVVAQLRRAEIILGHLPRPLPAGQVMEDVLTEIAQVPAGIPALSALQGVRPKIEYTAGLSVIAAPTSAGKTTYLVGQVAEWLLAPNCTGKILFWSAETPPPKLWAKILAAHAGVGMGVVVDEVKQASSRQGAVSLALRQALRAFEPMSERLIILDDNVTAIELVEVARQLAEEPDGLYAVVVDYLQELPAAPEGHSWARRLQSRELEVGSVARILRQFGTEYGIPVVAAAQFNRTVSKSSQYIPDLQQLRESGRIEQNAALVLGLRNETMSGAVFSGQNNAGVAPTITYRALDPEELEIGRQSAMFSVRQEHPDEDGWILMEVFVLKNREHGGVGTVVPFALRPEWGRIEPLRCRLTVHAASVKKQPSAVERGSHFGEGMSNNDDHFFERA